MATFNVTLKASFNLPNNTLGFQRVIDGLCQGAFLYFPASVAQIGRLDPVGAYLFLKISAVAVADRFSLFAHCYQWMLTVICPAYLFSFTRLSVFAGVVGIYAVTAVLLHRVIPYLLGNGRPVPSQPFSDLRKGQVFL